VHRQLLLITASLSFLLACGPKQPVHPQVDTSPLIEGRAKVLEVRNELGYALLDIKGKQVYGYWTTDPATAQVIANNPGAWNQAIAEDKPPIVQHQDFPGKPGDTIVFRGMMIRQDLYLRGVAVVSK
jgi:hypothetical protein